MLSNGLGDQDIHIIVHPYYVLCCTFIACFSESGQQPSDLTQETIQSFPMERVRLAHPLLAPGQQCRVCLRSYDTGQFVRRLPCHHKFHRDCIDDWLLHRHPTCPVDGTVFTNESVQRMREANRARSVLMLT